MTSEVSTSTSGNRPKIPQPGSFDAEILLTPAGATLVKSPSPGANAANNPSAVSPSNALSHIGGGGGGNDVGSGGEALLPAVLPQTLDSLESPAPTTSLSLPPPSKPSPPTGRPPPLPNDIQAKVSILSAQSFSAVAATPVQVPDVPQADVSPPQALSPQVPVFSLADATPDQAHHHGPGGKPVEGEHEYEDVQFGPIRRKSLPDKSEEEEAEEEEMPVTTGVLRLRVDNDLPVKKVKAQDVRTFATASAAPTPSPQPLPPPSPPQSPPELPPKVKKDPDYDDVEQPLEDTSPSGQVTHPDPRPKDPDYEEVDFGQQRGPDESTSLPQLLEVPDLVKQSSRSPDSSSAAVRHSSGTGTVASDASTNSMEAARKDILEGIRKMDSTIQSLRVGMIKVYEDIYTRPVYAVPAKKSTSTSAVPASLQPEEEPPENGQAEEENGQNEVEVTGNKENVDTTEENDRIFRENFLGICPNLEDVEVEESGLSDHEEFTNDYYPIVDHLNVNVEEEYNWDELMNGGGSVEDLSAQDVVAEKLRQADRTCCGLLLYLIHCSFSRSLKLDLQSSIFQRMYPTDRDSLLVNRFIACPVSLEEKYNIVKLSELLVKTFTETQFRKL